MRLTSFTDYGLRMLMVMAREPERLYSTQEIAEMLALSRHHLQKIVQTLADAGVLETQRGVAGGARLAKAPSAYRLGALVNILERDQTLVECLSPEQGACSLEGGCRLKSRLKRASRRFIDDLNQSTLADIALPATFLGVADNSL